MTGKKKVGIGVIGMGWMGAVHSRAYKAAVDRFPEGELEPELVLCADEVAERAREAQAAAAAGKHIFCEKPVGRSPQETAQIARAARQAGVLSWVGYNYRWAPVVQHGLGLIRQGALGRLTHYRGRFFAGYASNPKGVLSWRFQREVAGSGVLGDLMSHVVDMAQMLAGPVQEVVGNRECFIPQRPLAIPGKGTHFSVGSDGPLGEVTNEDYAGALVRFANGAQGSLEVCRVIQGPQCQMAFEVHGTEGALRWDFERMNELEVYSPQAGGYTRVLEEALAVARVLAAMERSWETRSWEEVRELG
jgi:predicted dehydrogenase